MRVPLPSAARRHVTVVSSGGLTQEIRSSRSGSSAGTSQRVVPNSPMSSSKPDGADRFAALADLTLRHFDREQADALTCPHGQGSSSGSGELRPIAASKHHSPPAPSITQPSFGPLATRAGSAGQASACGTGASVD